MGKQIGIQLHPEKNKGFNIGTEYHNVGEVAPKQETDQL